MTSDATQFVALMVRATRATRVLEIGTGTGRSGLAIAEALPPGGLLITLERDQAVAVAAREAFAAAGYGQRITTMIGDASRYLHKIAGPFDLVVQKGDVTQYESLHDRLVRLLGAAATLITHNTTRAGAYNGLLAADPRLTTLALSVGEGIAVSVRREHDL